MNKALGLIFTLISYNSLACYYDFSNGHDDIFKDAEFSTSVERCTVEESFRKDDDGNSFFVELEPEDGCECAQDNLDLFPATTDVLTPAAKAPFIQDIRDKAQIALLSLTEEIFNLDRQFNKSKQDLDITGGAKSCLLENAMVKDNKDSAFACENESEVMLSKAERKKISTELYEKFKHEIVHAKNADGVKGNGLIDRTKKTNQNTCKNPDISDAILGDLRDDSVERGLAQILKVLDDIPTKDGKDLRELVFESIKETDPKGFQSKKNTSLKNILDYVNDKELLNSDIEKPFKDIRDRLQSSPLIRHIVNDPTKYDELMDLKVKAAGNYPQLTQLKESMINEEKFRADRLTDCLLYTSPSPRD